MDRPTPPTTALFLELAKLGHIQPVKFMETLRLPGEHVVIQSKTSYGIPDQPIRFGTHQYAKLG